MVRKKTRLTYAFSDCIRVSQFFFWYHWSYLIAVWLRHPLNGLFPILGMTGCLNCTGIMLWLLAKRKCLLCKQEAITLAIFKIGESMVYGIALAQELNHLLQHQLVQHLMDFFIESSLYMKGVIFGLNLMFGPSGILAALIMTTNMKILCWEFLYI